jgi:hypothetical protein
MGISVDLPDPTTVSPGLASVVEISRQLGTSAAAKTALTEFAFGVQDTENFDSASTLAQFVATTQPPNNRRAITIASEQAVLAYDKTNPTTPLDAVYATSASQALGTPELDYPYVVTTSQTATLRAAMKFGNYLQTSYAQSEMRAHGFRSANGLPDVMPASAGLASQPLQLAGAASPTEAARSLQDWEQLGLGFRDLVLVDVSPAMNAPSGLGSTLEQVAAQTASQGLTLFPSNSQMGAWQIGKSSSASQPYDQVISLGPLASSTGLLTRRVQFAEILESTTTSPGGKLALYDSILDAYRKISATYQPHYFNGVIVLTAGVDSAPGDMSASALVAALHKVYNPNRQIPVVILDLGNQGSFPALQQVAAASGPAGAAFLVTNPAQVGQVFLQAVSLRMGA